MPAWSVSAFTHRGLVRPMNEDAIAVGAEILTGDMDKPHRFNVTASNCLLMIADGMGGHAHGALASKTVLDHLIADADRLSHPESCSDAIEAANERLFAMMPERPESSGMGTTLAGVSLSTEALVIFNVGDSRCYRFGPGGLAQLSHDDVASAAKDTSGHRRSHTITQCLGGSPFPVPVAPHVKAEMPLTGGETILLCSDGLTDMVQDKAIAAILADAGDCTQAVRDLATAALQAGGADNLSIIVARTSKFFPTPTAPEI